MLRIDCPHCGRRDHSEFAYHGDATVRRPDADTATPDDWVDYVYLRTNPRGRLRELWHHTLGCRAWLVVTRDTASHAIHAVEFARGASASGSNAGAADK